MLLLLRDVTEANRSETARRDFVLNASHELKTPIAALRAAAETLAHVGGLDDPEAARGFVDILERNAERLSRLVDDLLDLSRIESGQWAFEIAEVDAAAVAGQVVALLSALHRRRASRSARRSPPESRYAPTPEHSSRCS